MSGGSNGPDVILNTDATARYDRAVDGDSPIDGTTGLYVPPTKNLAALRNELMVLLGFASMAANPPLGMVALLNSWLLLAQQIQYTRYAILRTERWWPWQLQAGKRFYDVPVGGADFLNFRRITDARLADNGGVVIRDWAASTSFDAGTYIHPTTPNGLIYQVTTAGVTGATEPSWPTSPDVPTLDGTAVWVSSEPLPATWLPLTQGIDPAAFTDTSRGTPDRFDLHDFVEVFPAPDKPYVLWLRGHMGLRRFTEELDECTIDPHVILLFATAMGKKHYGQPDADIYAQMCKAMTEAFTGQQHGLRRYIPNAATGGLKDGGDGIASAPPRGTWRA